jgi:hypothetical protein
VLTRVICIKKTKKKALKIIKLQKKKALKKNKNRRGFFGPMRVAKPPHGP